MSIMLESRTRVSQAPTIIPGDAARRELAAAHVGLLCLWSLFLFCYGIGRGDLYRTEGLRAIVGAEMYRSGDWVVPRLYGEPILTKPPFFYWCIALTGHLFGDVTTWSARLPAAISGLLAVIVVYFTIRRYYGGGVALLAALALPVSFLWLDKASSAEIDTTLVLWVIAAWACFLRAAEEPPGLTRRGRNQTSSSTASMAVAQKSPLEFECPGTLQRSRRVEPGGSSWWVGLFWWVAALLCVAGGVLTKWTAFLFFYAMVIPTLVWHRRLFDLFRPAHLLAALLGAAVVCSWLAAVVAELGWSQVWTALWREGAPRVLHGQSARQHLLIETIVHPLKVLAIALPWSILALWGCRTRGTRAILVERSLLCWAVAGTVMMSLFPDHNTRQSFSLVPAWTLLGALSLGRLALTWNERTLRNVLTAGLVSWAAVKIGYVEILIPARCAERPDLASQAAILRAFVPEPCYLQLRAVKDECLMFNYGRPVRRVPAWDTFDLADETHCVLTDAERRVWPARLVARITAEQPLLDAQGDPLVVVRLKAASIR